MSQELAADWANVTSTSQLAVLEDRVVEAEEYKTAIGDGRACMQDLDFTVSEMRPVPDGVRLDFSVGVGARDEEDIARSWAGCRSKYYDAVESVWIAQHAAIGVTQEELDTRLGECLASAGVRGNSPGMRDDQIAQLIYESGGRPEAWVCREQHLILGGAAILYPPPPSFQAPSSTEQPVR